MRVTAVSLLLLLGASQQAFAWGQEGHSIIAEIAQRRLTREAADSIAKVLAPQPGAPVLSLPSFASVASWADDHREDHPETGAWHFIDGPLRETLDLNRDCPSNKGCVVSKLESLKNDLRCGLDAGKAEALKFAIHLVGDAHQPFHTVKEEAGGNAIHVHMLIPGDICKKSCVIAHEWQNLHEVWDSTLITKTFYSWGSYVDGLEKQDGPENERGWLAKADVAKESQGTPLDWANEAHAIAKDFWVADGATLDQFYYRKAKKVVDQQLGRGGLRLARYLNNVFSASTCPMQ